ncbi:helicase SRCAP isoform X2 [Thalassophryne amazonica]|uniref:helicase SRCAP isoform X2 n=1 Tax=Thalassophryne amazonica TaxID=390379 RepID=UPI001470E700|nr:helicase SRCAP isoform X2 [Thalassophryne amazonica]
MKTAPHKAEAAVGSLSLISPMEIVSTADSGMGLSTAVSVHVSHVQNQPSLIQSSGVLVVNPTIPEAFEGIKEAPVKSKPETVHYTQVSALLNPKLLFLKRSEPLLKHPTSFLTQVSKERNAFSNMTNTDGACSDTVSDKCLPQSVSAEDSLSESVAPSGQQSQMQCSVTSSASDTLTESEKDPLFVSKISAGETGHIPHSVSTPIEDTPPICDTLGILSASMEREGSVATPGSSNDAISQPGSFLLEEGEEMEQDESPGAVDHHGDTPGQASSPDESSEEEPEEDQTEYEMGTPTQAHKVRQWIADRVTMNSSPVSPASSHPGPSSSSDWSVSRQETSSLLRGPHGKFISPCSGPGSYSSSASPSDQATSQRSRGERHTDLAELAKHEADIEHRTQALKREGFWSMKRLTRLMEPPRPKVLWDYLCEEMQWLSADFAQERRWKRGVARKVVRMVMRHHEELRQKEEKAKRDEHAKIRRVASSIAKEVRAFWSSVEKVVQYKQQSRLEEKRKKALDLQLDFIVGQTEKYSDLLSQSLAPATPVDAVALPPQKSVSSSIDEEDRDFVPVCEEDDDEETIEVEEQQEGNDAESHQREIEMLKKEGMLPLDQLLSTLKLPQDSGSDEECSDESSASVEEEDREFAANEEDAEDEEETIAAQEKVEGNVDHAEELDDLAREGSMSIQELLEKYKGAYASDFEAPSASGSKASSDSEVSGDEEEETEEDESDVESNTSSSDSPGDSEEDEDSEKDEEESEQAEDDECGDEGMESLLKEGDHSSSSSSSRPKKEISHIAATAESLQPKGYTLATTKVKTPIPFLLHGTLREYQHIGLDWLVTMYEKKLNGILADEMGLGKTIQTIALLAHLACEKGNWGPHLIIVPTSVMLNWEMELKRWCPGFKILTYFGSQKERKLKRQGWTKPNAFHVCITSYKLVLQDHQAFRRKSWRYLILDEAQNIKNFKSQRWQSLLNFNSHRRLLLTGTPLQNSLMELWSLMHFLMPHVFQSHREFKEWFSNPLTGMIEGSQEYNEGLVKRLHKVLRPFLLRRIKADVEKQMPKKYEHVVRCRLSKRQRFLYDDFMAQASTRETLASGHFMSVINILMQLRKVCNHPNLFDPRPIQSPFITQPVVFHTASLVQDILAVSPFKRCDLSMFDLLGLEGRMSRYEADVFLPRHKLSRQLIQEIVRSPEPPPRPKPVRMKVNRMFTPPPKGDNRPVLLMNKPTCPVPPVTQTPKSSQGTETTSTSTNPPVVQQVVCSVAPTHPPRPPVHPATQTAVRSSTPKPMLAVRPPSALCTPSIPTHSNQNPSSVMPQRVLLSPDMQARLPSGEVVSIAQLASLAGRPVSSCQGSKPVTFQLQGNKLTLSGAQIHQVPAAAPRQVQGNMMHLVSTGVQHHLIRHPAQVAVHSAVNTHPANTTSATTTGNRLPQSTSTQVPSTMVSSPGVVKIVVHQPAGKEGGPIPTLAVAPSPRIITQTSPSVHHQVNTPAVRNIAQLQVSQRAPAPASAQQRPPVPAGTQQRALVPASAHQRALVPASTPQHVPLPAGTPQCPLVPASAQQRAPVPAGAQQRAPAPATAHYTLAPPRNASATPNQSQPPRPILKVVQPPSSAKQPVSTPPQVTSSSGATSSPVTRDKSSGNQTALPPKSKSCTGAKVSPEPKKLPRPPPRTPFYMSWLADSLKQQSDSRLDLIFRINELRCKAKPVYGQEVLDFLTFLPGPDPSPAPLRSVSEWGRSGHSSCLFAQLQNTDHSWLQSHFVKEAIHSIEARLTLLNDIIDRFTFVIPPVEAPLISMHCCHPPPSLSHKQEVFSSTLSAQVAPLTCSLHRIQSNMRTQFPDLRLIQYDCGKLQTLHTLLRQLKTGGHRVLIFTQMTRMLDVLEQFLNYHGHIYLRLDGSTRVEQRQALMERFNADRRIFCFILSTRSGGVGVNLTGADTVVFYDSDWNPTMDAQAQDRCHRIGQTRDVHIYRLISERTVEENILKKANQKRMLGDMAIEGGNFTTAFFKEQTIRELFDVNDGEKREVAVELSLPQSEDDEAVNKQSATILEQALCRAEDEEDIVAASQAKAEQVAELAEFNENEPLDDGGEQEEVEELSKAEQEIAALVEQLTPIERYAMNFLEASLEDVCKEELKQAEEQVEAARKGLDQAKEEGLKLHASSDEDDDFLTPPVSTEPAPTPARRGRKPKDKDKCVTSLRTSGRLRGASPEIEPDSPTSREVPERLRFGQRGRGAARDASTVSTSSFHVDHHKTNISTRLQESSKSSKTLSPVRDHHTMKARTQPTRSNPSPVPSPPTSSSPGGKLCAAESGSKYTKSDREEEEEGEDGKKVSGESTHQGDQQAKDHESKDKDALSPPSTSTSSRSPRKRQSADGEVRQGLVEDSPSAKVLRKLPGRLVTVVEDKEPRKRRRRGSGTGVGRSSEERAMEEHSEEPDKDNTSLSPDGKSKTTDAKIDQDQDFTPTQSPQPQPVRGYPPYSPPHLSPDMPVLRNLPVRRRLETESRMAAQLGEQQHFGRGKVGSQPRKTDMPPGKDTTSAATDSSVNSVLLPVKRKRGRPPKNLSAVPEPNHKETSLPQPTSPNEEENPPMSPKRKRGRPRKDSTISDTGSKKTPATNVSGPHLKTDGRAEPNIQSSSMSQTPTDTVVATAEGSKSTKAEMSDIQTELLATVSSSAEMKDQTSTTKTDQDSTVGSASNQTLDAPAFQVDSPHNEAVSTLVSAQDVSSTVTPVLDSDTASTQVSSTTSVTCCTPATIPVTATQTTTPHFSLADTLSSVGKTPLVSTASKDSDEPSLVVPSTENVESDSAKTVTVVPPAAETLPSVSSASTVRDPTSAPVTAIIIFTTITTDAASVAGGVTTTVKAVTTNTTVVKNLLQSSSLPAASSSSAKALLKPLSSSFPPTPTAMASTSTGPSPSTKQPSVPNTTLNISDPAALSEAPTPVTASALNTVPTLPNQAKIDVKPTKVPPESTSPTIKTAGADSQTQESPEAVLENSSATSPTLSAPVCSPSPTLVSASTDIEVTTSVPTEEAETANPSTLLSTVAMSAFKEHTSSNTATTEKTVNVQPPVATATIALPVPLLPTTTSTPPKSVTVTTTNAVTLTSASVAASTAATMQTDTLVTVTQTYAAVSSVVHNSAATQVSREVSTSAYTETPELPPAPCDSSVMPTEERQHLAPREKACASNSDPHKVTNMEVEIDVTNVEEKPVKVVHETKHEMRKSWPKRRNVDSSSETKDLESGNEEAGEESQAVTGPQKEPKQQAVEEAVKDEKIPTRKRTLICQSSQESARSSSPSSGCSTSTLTRHSHHKRTYENRHPAKRRRGDAASEQGKEDKKEGEKEEVRNSEKEFVSASRRRRCRSSSSSSDSEGSNGRKEHRLTRSAKRRLQDQEEDKGNNTRQAKRPTRSSDRNTSNNTTTSTGGESGSDTSSVRITRNSLGLQPVRENRTQKNSLPSLPPEPEVLGKRCSALNAAAKLQAMKGRVDTPGHTTRKDSGAKAAMTSPTSSSDKNQKPKSKSVLPLPQSNSSNNKSSGSKSSPPNQSSCSTSRSTRRCPGSFVPPLETEYKRSKPEEKERGSRKSSGKEGDAQSSSRGHSACSSMSSDGEGDAGGCSSRSSSNSSRRTCSISSQNMEHRESHSRATSSGSDRETEQAKYRDKTKERQGHAKESQKEGRRSHRLPQESTRTEGTPDRVLRSVTALAVVQARSPAANTRSSSSQHRHNKT